jgi:hypothetical protein
MRAKLSCSFSRKWVKDQNSFIRAGGDAFAVEK